MDDLVQKLHSIGDVSSKFLAGRRVFVRLDLNVPVKGKKILDDFRIKRALPTLQYLAASGACMTLASHYDDAHETYAALRVELAPYLLGGNKFLPNLRRDPREEMGDISFAVELAQDHDFYVNEAFSVSHRNHASIVRMPELLPSYAGLNFINEVKELARAFSPSHPFIMILGGAKCSTKIPLLKKFLSLADKIFLGGAVANTFLSHAGIDVKRSLVEDVSLRGIEGDGKIILPQDYVWREDMIADVGEKAISSIEASVRESAFVLWNGPLGMYEGGYDKATNRLAEILSHATGDTLLGGGDTIAAVRKLGLLDHYTFVSTGGGAMLEFLATGTLPGIEALMIDKLESS